MDLQGCEAAPGLPLTGGSGSSCVCAAGLCPPKLGGLSHVASWECVGLWPSEGLTLTNMPQLLREEPCETVMVVGWGSSIEVTAWDKALGWQ